MSETLEKKRVSLPIYGEVSRLTEVYYTKDYELFGFIKGNREINQTNLNNIKESLSKKQILEILTGVQKVQLKLL